MRRKRRIGFQSALLVSWGVIGFCFGGAILLWRFGLSDMGALLMAAAVTGLAGRLWGLYALRGLEAEAVPERETLAAGQTVTVHYALRNNKALPLLWVEVLQDVPARDCLTPDEGFSRQRFSPEEAERTGRREAYRRRLAYLPGYGSLEWDTVWTGTRRGVYRPQELILRSGDGFGLAQSAGELRGLKGQVIVVWPKLIPVRTMPFMRHVWSGETGRAGWTEDPTVLRGERAYQPGDPWKRIDWRTAARTDELMVRQYETIRPLRLLFILDAASMEDREEAISLVASLIFALAGEGIACGLALPAAGNKPPVLLRPEETDAAACLFALAELEAERAGTAFDEEALLSAAGTGQVWMITESARRPGCGALAARLEETGLRYLCPRRESGGRTYTLTFDEVRRKEES